MSSIIARIFNLKCVDIYGNLDYVNPFVCATESQKYINPYWVLTADVFLVMFGLGLVYFIIRKFRSKNKK